MSIFLFNYISQESFSLVISLCYIRTIRFPAFVYKNVSLGVIDGLPAEFVLEFFIWRFVFSYQKTQNVLWKSKNIIVAWYRTSISLPLILVILHFGAEIGCFCREKEVAVVDTIGGNLEFLDVDIDDPKLLEAALYGSSILMNICYMLNYL